MTAAVFLPSVSTRNVMPLMVEQGYMILYTAPVGWRGEGRFRCQFKGRVGDIGFDFLMGI